MGQIDTKAMDSISALQRPGKPDLLARVIGLFQADAPASIESIIAAAESGDLEQVRVLAHSLKSSSAYLGANSFSARMRDLEAAAREGNLPACIALSDGLAEHYDEVNSELLSLQDKAA